MLKNNKVFNLLQDRLIDPFNSSDLTLKDTFFQSESSEFPIHNGVARFVKDNSYLESFGFEWNTHTKTQIDSITGEKESERQFLKKTGFSKKLLQNKLVLDAGIGAGRFADIASGWGANVLGIDLSNAVDAAHKNLHKRDNVLIFQADIAHIPVKPNTFDYIYCIGVLHHTPNTYNHFKYLLNLLKPGGTIAIWVYPNDQFYSERALWTRFINKIPTKHFHMWCEFWIKFVDRHRDSQLVNYLKNIFPTSQQGFGIDFDILDTFDGVSPKYHWVHSVDEVKGWFKECNLIDVQCPSDWITCVSGKKRLLTKS